MNKFNYITFFDAEYKIFNFKSKDSFLEYFLLETLPLESYAQRAFKNYLKRNEKNITNGMSETFINREYFKNFSGMPVKLLLDIAYSWYVKTKLELKDNFFNQKTLYEIEMHKRNNAQIIILSRSFLPCLGPFLEEFSISSAISVELEVINGYYTGNILSDPITAHGKEKAIKNFLVKQNSLSSNDSKCLKGLEEGESHFCDIPYDYNEDIINSFTSEKFKTLYRN